MEHSEEYYKMKYFKYKAKYIKEKQAEQSGGMTLAGQAIAGLVKIPVVLAYEGGKALVKGVGNLVGRTPKETKQKALKDALEYLAKKNINTDDIKTNYKKIKEEIKKIKGDDLERDKILKQFKVCDNMVGMISAYGKEIDNECIDLKK